MPTSQPACWHSARCHVSCYVGEQLSYHRATHDDAHPIIWASPASAHSHPMWPSWPAVAAPAAAHHRSGATDLHTSPFVPPRWRPLSPDLPQIPFTFPPRCAGPRGAAALCSKARVPLQEASRWLPACSCTLCSSLVSRGSILPFPFECFLLRAGLDTSAASTQRRGSARLFPMLGGCWARAATLTRHAGRGRGR